MDLTAEIRQRIDKSILCWLATSSSNNIPNVSPKEIFSAYNSNQIIIANIASPESIKNIRQNQNVCVSFIDILVQKGFQVKGTVKIIESTDSEFSNMEKILLKMTGGKFPFSSIINVIVEKAKPIIAPKYILYPETTEEQQIESAKKAYGIE
jgi:predicted pyridoxine 5'-phosphate oxidase superfamily flavin-nucleotide-binding protein